MQTGDPTPPVDVVVLGSANMDLALQVDTLPRAGETVLAGPAQSRPGGKGANQAVAAARAGARVAFVGCVGDDADGATIRTDLVQSGIHVEHLLTTPDHRTGLAVVLVGTSGENLIAVSPGANHQLRPTDLEPLRTVIAGAAVLLMQLEVPLGVVDRAVQLASEAGTTVVLNLSPAAAVSAETLRAVDVLIVNRAEAEYVLGSPTSDAPLIDLAARVRELGPAAAVVTGGADGAACASADEVVQLEALPVPVVDTTGAGDAFAGALAAELAGGASLVAAARAATLAGAAAVQHHGARPSADDRSEAGVPCG